MGQIKEEKLEKILTDMLLECVDMHPNNTTVILEKYKKRILKGLSGE